MPSLSQRAQQMPMSPLRKLAATAADREATGVTVYKLNIGQPDLETPPEFFTALQEFHDNPVAYARSQGIAEALDAWRGYYAELGIPLEREELMITTGGSEALVFAMCSLADPGDNIIVFEPFYTNYNGFGKIAGVDMKPVTLSIDNGFHLPSREEIEAAITPTTRAMLVCNPSNPTGTVFTRDELQMLVDIAIEKDIFIIADEVYREFGFDQKVTSLLEFPEAADRVVMVDSASKRFNACGVRIGTLVSKNRDVIATSVKFGMARLSVASIEQLALIPVLEKAREIIPPVVEEYRRRRDVMYEGLRAIDGIEVTKPEGAFYIICELPVDSAEQFAKWMIEEFEHEGETLLVAPAAGFYATPGKGAKEIRLAYVLDEDKLRRSLELLSMAITEYNATKK